MAELDFIFLLKFVCLYVCLSVCLLSTWSLSASNLISPSLYLVHGFGKWEIMDWAVVLTLFYRAIFTMSQQSFSFQNSTMYANDSSPGNYSVGSSISIDINLYIFILCCWGFLSRLHTLHINGDGSFIFLF